MLKNGQIGALLMTLVLMGLTYRVVYPRWLARALIAMQACVCAVQVWLLSR